MTDSTKTINDLKAKMLSAQIIPGAVALAGELISAFKLKGYNPAQAVAAMSMVIGSILGTITKNETEQEALAESIKRAIKSFAEPGVEEE